MRWLEENETDARVGPDWLFDYTSLFKYFNVFSDDFSGTSSGTKAVLEDEEEDVVYRPLVVPHTTSTVDATVPSSSSDSPSQQINLDADATPLTPSKREFMTRDTFATTQTFM